MRVLRTSAFLIYGVALSAGCSGKPDGPNKDPNAGDHSSDSLSAAIIGTWENCTSEFGETKVTVKDCRTIEFKKDSKGVITHGDLSKENISWTISGGDLQIELIDRRTDSMFFAFTDTLYVTSLTKDGMRNNLDLKAKHKDVIYHLSK